MGSFNKKMGMKKRICTLLAAVLLALPLASQTKVIAHRGFWNTEGSAQNSITALEKAADAQVYGAEFDVWITRDGVAVVNHNKDINGIVIEKTDYEDLKGQRLSNGETIPTLEEYLKEGARYRKMKLVLELKDHSTDKNDMRAVEVVAELVRDSKAYRRGQMEFISFNYEMCKRFAELFPDIPVAYLNGDKSPAALKKVGIDGLDYHKTIMAVRKDWIREAHNLGMTVNVWTVNKDASILKMKEIGVDFITTDHPLRAKELLEQGE